MELPSGFDLRAISAFMLVAELGSMTHAAKRLGMTQPTISEAIAKLEASVGTKLFDRTVRPIALTTAGHALLRHGNALMNVASDVLHSVRGAGSQALPVLTLSMAETFANVVGPILVRELNHLASRWRIRQGISPDHHGALLDHSADVVVTTSDELDAIDGLERHELMHETFVIVCPIEWKVRTAGLAELVHRPMIRISQRSAMGRQIEGQINRLRISIPFYAEFDTAIGQLAAVADGLGWSLTTPLCLAQEKHMSSRLTVLPMTKGRFARAIKLIARRGRLADIPAKLAVMSRQILAEKIVPEIGSIQPWLSEELRISDGGEPSPLAEPGDLSR
jgi:DNA-binding transcriptional LysR family regulator